MNPAATQRHCPRPAFAGRGRCRPPLLRWLLATLLALAALLAAPPAAATIVFISAASGRNDSLPTDGSAGALTITRPSGTAPGQALVASIAARPHGMTATAPSGWVQMTSTNQTNGGASTAPGGMTLVTYYKIVTTSEPASYTWTFANPAASGGSAVGGILTFSGINTAAGNPIDNSGTAWSDTLTGSGITHGTRSIRTVTANTMVVSSISFLSASNFDAPTGISGLVERLDQSAPLAPGPIGTTLQMATAAVATTGQTGATSATAAGSDSDYGVGHLMALMASAIDPALSMTRAAALVPGGIGSYALTVTNQGLSSEPGPLTIVDTLPSGLSFTSFSGTGWTCGASGQTVTCTRIGALAADATAPLLTINVSVAANASGTLINSATVSGTGGDSNTSNNTAVNAYVVPSAVYAYWQLDESSWGTVTDASGNGRNASVLGSASPTGPTPPSPPGAAIAGATGTCGAGLVPAGTTAIGINTGIDPNSLGNAGTLMFWHAGNSAWNDGTARMLFDASNDLASGDRHFYLVKQGNGVLSFSLKDSAGTVSTASTVSYAYPASEWHHIAVSWDIAANSLKIYVDGSLAGSASTALNGSLGDTATLYLGAQRMAGVTGTASGYTANTAHAYLDEVRLYSGVLSASEVVSLLDDTHTCYSTLLASYRFEDTSWNGSAGELKDTAGYSGVPYNGKAQGSPLPGMANAAPARSGSSGTCGYASLPGPAGNGGSFVVSGLPVSTTAGAQTSVSFWMYWNGVDPNAAIGWNRYSFGISGGFLGFSTDNNDVYGMSAAGLANGWHHVVVVFTNGSVTANKVYLDGIAQTLSQRTGTPSLANAVVQSSLTIGGYGATTGYRFTGKLDEVQVYQNAVTDAQVATLYAQTHTCPILLDHLEIQHASGSGLTCTPSTVTVRACQDIACSIPYTGGVSGMLSATGGVTVNWPNTAAFGIAAGASSTTVDLQLVSAGSVVLSTSALSITANNASSCNFGSPACTFTAADSGLLFDVPNHRAEVSNVVTVTAVKKADNSATCIPAFASVSKSVNFKCSYGNPASGTLPVRIGGAALNSANSSAAACDGVGRAISLAFNAGGVASTTVQYADVGLLTLTGTYTGSGTGVGGDAGLTMLGSDTFIAAPYDFAVSGIPVSAISAGSAFAASVTARNSAGGTTPNFGRESSAESVTLGFVRSHPSGTGAVNGSFSGSTGAFSAGSASASNLVWTEVGRGDVSARLASSSYLGSGMTAAGSSAGALVSCANEGGTCTLPTGATATVYYGALGRVAVQAGLSGSVGCSSAVFGDPAAGVGKTCFYVATAGASPGATGTATAKPHHFDVTTSAACSSFSYAGQAFSATVTARNAGNATTLNYDGSANTSPNFAKATSLSEPTALGVGTLSGNSIAASAFSAGVASAGPTYSYTSKTTGIRTLGLRATDTDAVSSSGFAEGSMPLRSGRLRLSNAFGSASAALQVPVVAEYWSGNSWVLNSADNCTLLAAGNVVLSNPRNAAGGTSSATSSAGATVLANGSGLITLTAPTPSGSSLSLDLALNLGSSTADLSCQASHPASVGAAKPWLRAQNGSCAASADRDPSARASFGLYSPESRKTVHARDIF